MGLVERIKLLCEKKSTNFAEVERRIGISNGQIRRWNDSSPKLENVKKVAEYFNVSLDYLTGLSEEQMGEWETEKILEKLFQKFELAGFIIRQEDEEHYEYIYIEHEEYGIIEKIFLYNFIEQGEFMLNELKEKYPNKNQVETIAAHHDGEEWTDEELEEIEQFKEFVRMKRKQ